MASVVNLFLTYSFIRRLVKPFNQWDAYKTGVIDRNGNLLIPPNKQTHAQRRSFQSFDIMVRNMKRLLDKIPGGGSRFATFTAALFLLKENTEEIDNDKFMNFLSEMDVTKFREFLELIDEDGIVASAPTNNVGSGNIAGMNGDGPANPKLIKATLKRKKLMSNNG